MLAGCSSSLLSPRHRLRSEAATQFQVCHFPSMSTQRLDLPCNFGRKPSTQAQPVRPVGLSIDKSIEAKTAGCSLRQNARLPPIAATDNSRKEIKDEFWDRSKSLKKRYADEVVFDEDTCTNRSKRKRGNGESNEEEEDMGFWFQTGFSVQGSVPIIAGLNTSQVPFSLTCSGEEERMCFVPNEMIVPPNLPPLSNIPWFDSVITEITELGDKNDEIRENPVKQKSSGSSSTSSENRGLDLRLRENPVERDIGNGSSNPRNQNENVGIVGCLNTEDNHMEHECVELVRLLVACVENICSRDIPSINNCLSRLGELASPRGRSPLQRLVAYYTEALSLRVTRLWPHIFHIMTPRDLDQVDDEIETSWRLLNQVSPIPKFIHFTCNEILLRAFEGKDRVHIIDFDIKQGLQWPSMFQSLASRTSPPSHVRITGVGESKQELIETGERLAGFAGALNLPFEFHPVVDRLEDVRLWMLHVKERECVAVNCVFQMHKMLYDTNGGMLRNFLGLIRSTNAEIVLMAEQEVGNNEQTFDARFSNSLKYYSAVFDSIDSSLPIESPGRIKIEEMFGREIRNIIACEGPDRFERHETCAKWKQLMEQGGFRCVGIQERELSQGQMLLKMYSCENYSVEKKIEQDVVTLSWLDQPLYTVSAWSPVDVAGSSSSFSQPI